MSYDGNGSMPNDIQQQQLRRRLQHMAFQRLMNEWQQQWPQQTQNNPTNTHNTHNTHHTQNTRNYNTTNRTMDQRQTYWNSSNYSHAFANAFAGGRQYNTPQFNAPYYDASGPMGAIHANQMQMAPPPAMQAAVPARAAAPQGIGGAMGPANQMPPRRGNDAAAPQGMGVGGGMGPAPFGGGLGAPQGPPMGPAVRPQMGPAVRPPVHVQAGGVNRVDAPQFARQAAAAAGMGRVPFGPPRLEPIQNGQGQQFAQGFGQGFAQGPMGGGQGYVQEEKQASFDQLGAAPRSPRGGGMGNMQPPYAAVGPRNNNNDYSNQNGLPYAQQQQQQPQQRRPRAALPAGAEDDVMMGPTVVKQEEVKAPHFPTDQDDSETESEDDNGMGMSMLRPPTGIVEGGQGAGAWANDDNILKLNKKLNKSEYGMDTRYDVDLAKWNNYSEFENNSDNSGFKKSNHYRSKQLFGGPGGAGKEEGGAGTGGAVQSVFVNSANANQKLVGYQGGDLRMRDQNIKGKKQIAMPPTGMVGGEGEGGVVNQENAMFMSNNGVSVSSNYNSNLKSIHNNGNYSDTK